MNPSRIDQSVYPDMDTPPVRLNSMEEKADYVQRVCCAWDYGIHPEPYTFELLAGWKDVFDRFPVLTSIAYHAMRAWFGWEALSFPKGLPVPMLRWEKLDQQEGRGPDPCENLI